MEPVTVVLYDLDGTLITPKGKNKFPKGSDDWRWWHDSVPGQLKKDVHAGKHVVVLSNQAFRGEKVRKEWRGKLPLIAAKVGCSIVPVLTSAWRRPVPRAGSPREGRIPQAENRHVRLSREVVCGEGVEHR